MQRQFKTNWSVEVRYLGTRGIHLLTQNRINRIGKVARDAGTIRSADFPVDSDAGAARCSAA